MLKAWIPVKTEFYCFSKSQKGIFPLGQKVMASSSQFYSVFSRGLISADATAVSLDPKITEGRS